MNYDTMQHLNRERLDRRLHEATAERLVQSQKPTRRRAWSWVGAAWSHVPRPSSGNVAGVAQPQA